MIGLRKNLSNLFGVGTDRKIVIIESDDWGSIRIRSKADYDSMIKSGLELNRSNFTRFDSLESNEDLIKLFEILLKHKDSKGKHPVFTPMCLVANPDFEKIQVGGYNEYHYESFIETCKRYPNHDKTHELWLKGIKERLFVPELHGREHLNTLIWIEELRKNNEGIRLEFDHQSLGAKWFKGNRLPEYRAAFDPKTQSEVLFYPQIIETAASLFQTICGYKSRYFIASNKPEPKSLEKTLKMVGVDFLSRYKFQKYPLGNGKYNYELNWIGKENNQNQIILTRNCGFEPSDASVTDWVDTCLSEIKNAFYWHKPAIISTHRVNYIGEINPENASNGLKELDRLLSNIIKRWPDVEFLTSVELGDLIKNNKCINN